MGDPHATCYMLFSLKLPTEYLLFAVHLAMTASVSLAADEFAPDFVDSTSACPQRGICAHRGASDTHPENTLASLEEAVRLGAHMVEFDVVLTKDRQLVLMHDETVDRTTDGTGRVGELTLAELRLLDAGGWKNARFQGERIPTLQQALSVMPINIWLNIHLKGNDALSSEVARCVVQANRLHQVLLACDLASAAAAHAVDSRIMVCNMERTSTSLQYVDATVKQGAEFIQLLGRRSVAWHRISDLKRHGVRINYCCTNEADELRRLWRAGVDFPLVDRVAQMLVIAEQAGIKRVQPIYANTE